MNNKNLSIQEKVQIAELKERFYFKKFKEHYNLFNIDDGYTVELSPIGGGTPYDVIVHKFNNDIHYQLEKRYLIEIKYRNEMSSSAHILSERDGYFLEELKYKGMKKKQEIDPERTELLYLVFSKNCTYLWNLDLMERKGCMPKLTKEEMNRTNIGDRRDKVNKNVYNLDKKYAKRYDYIGDVEEFNMATLKEKRDKEVQSDIHKGYVCIFKDIN